MKSTNLQKVRITKDILKLDLKRWILRIFKSKSNSRKMLIESNSSDGMIWELETKLKLNKFNQTKRNNKINKRRLSKRRVLISPKVADQPSRNQSMSETNQISPSWATSNLLKQNSPKLTTVVALVK